MAKPKICPFCNRIISLLNNYSNLNCDCGAKYYWESDVWTCYDKTKKERIEVEGDLWN